MSWAILLSKYPKSILDKEFPSIVLAWMEKVGITNEENLQKDLGIAEQKLNLTLADLYRNSLIEYGSSWIRVSEQGKFFLEQLGVDDSIVQDCLDILELSKDEFKAYQAIVREYRSEAYRSYLGTLSSMRMWDTVCSTYSIKDADYTGSMKSKGKLALLLKALRNWTIHTVHTVSNETKLEGFSPSVRRFLTDQDIHQYLAKSLHFSSEPAWQHSTSAMSWLYSCRVFDPSTQSLSDRLSSLTESQKVFLIIGGLQADSEEYDFWKELNSGFKEISSEEESKKDINWMITAINKYYSPIKQQSQQSRDIEKQEQFSLSSNSLKRVDFLVMLLVSESIEQFANKTGLNVQSVKTLIEKVSSKCTTLLERHENKE